MSCLPLSDLEAFASALVDGIKAELFLTPKPGLVDLADVGSHPDLSLVAMVRSVALLRDYLRRLALAIHQQRPFSELQTIGQTAEQRMLTELGSNSHRGGIFLSGLLLYAYADCGSERPDRLSHTVALHAVRYFQQTRNSTSNGQLARQRYQTGGIISECLNGLPGVFKVALPVLRANGGDFQRGCYLAMARLMQYCDDTTCLHRGGQTGLERMRRAGAELEQSLLSGSDPQPLLRQFNEDFRSKNLTMGGVADLLGLTFGYLNFTMARGTQAALVTAAAI